MSQQLNLPFLNAFTQKTAAEGFPPEVAEKKEESGGGGGGGTCSKYSRSVGANMVCDSWASRMQKEGADAPPGYRTSDSAKKCSTCQAYSGGKK